MAGELNHRETGKRGASAQLAHFAVAASWDSISPKVRHQTKRALINFFATALAGCKDPALLAATQVFNQFRSSQDCTVIGHAQQTDMLHAASLNAMSGNVFDFDDTHMPTIIHPTAPVAPVVLALAQTKMVSGPDLLAAFAVGVEVECRLGNAVSPWHYERGWHITSTCGVFGAAAAAGRLLGLSETQMLWALGNASAQSSGLVQTLGSMAKSIGVGNAASNGLLAAMLARKGFEGPALPIEGPRGFLKVMGENSDTESISHELGTHWELMHNAYKPYPCGVVLNPVIQACLEMHHEQGARLSEVERVELMGHPLLRQRTDRPTPASRREAQVSAQHAIAMALARGKAGLDEFSDASVALPQAKALSLRTSFTDDDSYAVESVQVKLHMRNGSILSRSIAQARGSLSQPMSDTDLENKLRDLCRWGSSGCNPQALMDSIWTLDQSKDVSGLMQLAAGAH